MEDNKNKYVCKSCNFSCNQNSRWQKHIDTELHKTGQRKKRSDYKEPFKCKDCDYQSKNSITLKKHILNIHSSLEQREKEFKFYCKHCNFGTFSIDMMNLHNNTDKHKRHIMKLQMNYVINYF